MTETNIKNMRIVIRRDTAANWEYANPVLLRGEQGYETDLRGLKIGDGITNWNDLPYFIGFTGLDGGAPDTDFSKFTGQPAPTTEYTPEPIGTAAPIAIDGYYPLYRTREAALSVSNGVYHTHIFDGVVYYMPEGVQNYHGTWGTSSSTY